MNTMQATFDWNAVPEYSRLRMILGAITVLNLFDAIFTLFWVQAQLATEANPLMDVLLQLSPVLFVLCKILLVYLGTTLFWMYRYSWVSIWASYLILSVFVLIIFYHFLGLYLFL